ncbi:MAG: hypothetical protein ACTIJ6_02935 [Leucobacter sp.]
MSFLSPASPYRLRIRPVGSISTTLVLVGTAVLAPFSIPSATAADGQIIFAPDDRQMLVSTDADNSVIDLDVTLDEDAPSKPATPAAEYTLEQFMFSGSVNWGGYRFTYYSQQVLPGGGLAIPGRHVNAGGYVSDSDGYIVLAGSAPKGTVFETPFGHPGKIYDRGTVGNHLDVYIK